MSDHHDVGQRLQEGTWERLSMTSSPVPEPCFMASGAENDRLDDELLELLPDGLTAHQRVRQLVK